MRYGALLAALALILVLVVAATAGARITTAQASAAPPFLSIAEGRANLNKLLEKLVRQTEATNPLFAVYDWQIRACFRSARNAVQCRWSYIGQWTDTGSNTRCYGNMRAVARWKAGGPRYIVYSRVISSRCASA
jgi:hypothetical protein